MLTYLICPSVQNFLHGNYEHASNFRLNTTSSPDEVGLNMSLFRGDPSGKFQSNRLTQVLTIGFYVLFAPKLMYLNKVWDNFYHTEEHLCTFNIP